MRALAALLLAGCFKPVIAAGDPCETGNDWCPDELTCVDHVCVARAGDAGADGDSGGQPGLNVMFVSSTPFVIPTGGSPQASLVAADAQCQDLAAGHFDGNFKAWLGITNVPAKSRLLPARGWVRPDHLPFGDDLDTIIQGQQFYPPVVDETNHRIDVDVVGRAVTKLPKVLTNTLVNGAAAGSCGDLTSQTGTATAGTAAGAIRSFTALVTLPMCSDGGMHLYCFQTDHVVGVDHPAAPADAKRAFLTDNSFIKFSAGGTTADDVCQMSAVHAGYSGTYRALMAGDGTTPRDRLNLPTLVGPWVRPDGVVVSQDLRSLDAAIDQTPDGLYRDVLVWTGTTAIDQPGTATTTCANWTAPGAQGNVSTSSIVLLAGEGGPIDCNNQAALFCVQTD